jgi:hypothetical protein
MMTRSCDYACPTIGHLGTEEAEAVLSVLRITPVHAAVVTDLLDTSLASAFSSGVLRADSEEMALLLTGNYGDFGSVGYLATP